MHQVLHLAILSSTLIGAAALVVLVVWPLASDTPLAPRTTWVLAGFVAVASLLLGVEWLFVH